LLPPQGTEESSELATLRRNLHLLRTAPSLPDDPEQINFPVSEAQARFLGKLDDLPLTVLTQGKSVHFPPEAPEDFATYIKERYHPMHLEFQAELANLSTRGRQIMAFQSGHMIHEDEPDLVITAVREVTEISRRGGGFHVTS
jgi:hypothetical protein